MHGVGVWEGGFLGVPAVESGCTPVTPGAAQVPVEARRGELCICLFRLVALAALQPGPCDLAGRLPVVVHLPAALLSWCDQPRWLNGAARWHSTPAALQVHARDLPGCTSRRDHWQSAAG